MPQARTPRPSRAPTPQSTRSSTRPACSEREHSRSSRRGRACSRRQPLPRGRRVGVITNAGGLGILCADACESAGLDAARANRGDARSRSPAPSPAKSSLGNPVDLLGSATAATYEAVIPHVLADPNVDALIVIFVPPVVAGADEVAAAIRRAVELNERTKPVVAVVISAEGTPSRAVGAGSPVVALPYPESAARALAFACRTRRLARAPRERRRSSTSDSRLQRRERRRRRRLRNPRTPGSTTGPGPHAARGIRHPARPRADRARAPTRRRGRSPRARLPGRRQDRRARRPQDRDRRGRARPSRRRRGSRGSRTDRRCPSSSSRFSTTGRELLAGAVQDPVFGPLVAFGPGGANRRADRRGRGSGSHRSPISTREELVRDGKAGRLVAGFRGAAPADASALVDLLLRLARLVEDIPEVAELDLNPILARPRRLRRSGRPRSDRGLPGRAARQELVSSEIRTG